MLEFEEWESFYVIVGGGAAALIGLQFVVLTLIAEKPSRGVEQASAAFATPTIVHFSIVLLLAALLRVPWHVATSVAIPLGLVGFGGFIYAVIVIRRMVKQSAYKPQFEDWLFHALLPTAAHLILVLSACVTASHAREAMFGVAAAALLLLFVGIHNAWDAVAYHVFSIMRNADTERTN